MATREKGRKRTKQEAPQEASQQYKVTDPISMADLEEAQEFNKEIAEKVIEKELKKQKYEQYQQAKQTSNY